jgi:hypothetical protein
MPLIGRSLGRQAEPISQVRTEKRTVRPIEFKPKRRKALR